MTVRLMKRDRNNPTDYSIDTEYPFDGSIYSASIGSYSYQLKMLFDQSDNVKSITYTTTFTANETYPGYYDNNGSWHQLSSNSGTILISGLSDYDYSRGILFGVTFSGSYTTSVPAVTPIPKIGSNDISKIYLGSEEISKIYLGSEVIYNAV